MCCFTVNGVWDDCTWKTADHFSKGVFKVNIITSSWSDLNTFINQTANFLTHCINSLVQDCTNSIANTLELLQPLIKTSESLQWHHNECNGILNHHHLDCLFNHLFRCRSQKTSKLRFTGHCEGNSQVNSEFPTKRASNAENVSFWWRHHNGPGTRILL